MNTAAPRPERKLVLVMIDSLRADMLLRAVESGVAPTLGKLIERGELVHDCVSSFPSVTPVACAEMVTGERASKHGIPGMNWFHRAEGRYIEYGSSWEATRAFGLFRTLYDTVYNMNLAHLSAHTPTLFERLGDAGLRTACTPFLIYRGRRRHELGLEGLMRRAATAAKFHHAVWGPDELFYGELYASRRTPCKPTLGRPGTRDAYTACVAKNASIPPTAPIRPLSAVSAPRRACGIASGPPLWVWWSLSGSEKSRKSYASASTSSRLTHAV